MPGLKVARLLTNMRASDFRIEDTDRLDQILVDLCDMVVQGQRDNPDYYGVVAAAVLDPANRLVMALNHTQGRKDVHAERAAIDKYTKKYGRIPDGSTIVTTCSPCTEPMPERVGSSCQDLISSTPVHKVYAGYRDPSQQTAAGNKTYHLRITKNKKIQELCQQFANTWLKDQLDELEFLGSTCTKDCSGHRAGYAWSQSKGGQVANSPFSPSFNKGSQLHVDGK
jgi:pyrimidine deaminase RibD-like protein